jgi:hypothetical protein
MALNHGAHAPVKQEDTLLEKRIKVQRGYWLRHLIGKSIYLKKETRPRPDGFDDEL